MTPNPEAVADSASAHVSSALAGVHNLTPTGWPCSADLFCCVHLKSTTTDL